MEWDISWSDITLCACFQLINERINYTRHMPSFNIEIEFLNDFDVWQIMLMNSMGRNWRRKIAQRQKYIPMLLIHTEKRPELNFFLFVENCRTKLSEIRICECSRAFVSRRNSIFNVHEWLLRNECTMLFVCTECYQTSCMFYHINFHRLTHARKCLHFFEHIRDRIIFIQLESEAVQK